MWPLAHLLITRAVDSDTLDFCIARWLLIGRKVGGIRDKVVSDVSKISHIHVSATSGIKFLPKSTVCNDWASLITVLAEYISRESYDARVSC